MYHKIRKCPWKFFLVILDTCSDASSVLEGNSKTFLILQGSLLNFTRSLAGNESYKYYFVTGVN